MGSPFLGRSSAAPLVVIAAAGVRACPVTGSALRFEFGFTGATLTAGAVDLGVCTRCTAQAIADYLATQL